MSPPHTVSFATSSAGQDHSMYSRSSSSGSLKSAGTTNSPLQLPAFGNPETGGRGRLGASR
jgi:hypothetical protein